MKPTLPIAAAALVAAVAVPSQAIFIRAGDPVPMARLLKNIGDYVKANPKDAQGYYTLGRLHSLAFMRGEVPVSLGQRPDAKLPFFPGYDSIKVRPDEKSGPSAARAAHLKASINNYTKATLLDPKKGLYHMGLGWMLEQGAPFASQIPAPFMAKKGAKEPADRWLDQALRSYTMAYDADLAADLKRGGLGPGADSSIALEAGEGILRITEKRPLNEVQKGMRETVAANVEKLKMLPRAVTPIVFPLDSRSPLSALVDSRRASTFDLGGDGRAERWPWLSAQTGILVWDPEHKGRIESGTQLFGSVTWSMFWRDGYAPLAALDDNGDGWLSGRELKGISVWVDADGDAVSDGGEVQSLAAHAIARISVRAAETGAEGPSNPRGIQFRDGSFAPTYDWTPTSVPLTGRVGAGKEQK